MTVMLIRRYRDSDVQAMHRLYPWEHSLQQLSLHIGSGWVAVDGAELLGHAYTIPYPGLPGIEQLCLYVAPPQRRAGVGSALLQHLLAAAPQDGIRQLNHKVESLQDETARFLQRRDFYPHHGEWEMLLAYPEQLPPPTLPAHCQMVTLPRAEAITTFRRLYDESFRDVLSYQPYSYDDVDWELERAEDLLFLRCDGAEAGFVWLHHRGERAVEIEPVGLLPAYHGQGLGQAMMLAALHSAARQGVTRVKLTVWRENERAVRLYQKLGFERVDVRYYLAYDVPETSDFFEKSDV